ncbi:MAG: HAMP domain-containing histidine kinase, partial [Desulfovibrio sp.]|nr:HAMP domain-containing histidine kinase [Desulfovibrio sp.]
LRPEDNTFQVRIADNGRGISAEARANLFTPYFTTKPSGTGLGLAIVQQIIEGHGGGIAFADGEGAGSVFTLTLPLGKR